MATYDSDHAARDCQRMWRRLAKACEGRAIEAAERGLSAVALERARLAEAAYWQAVGDGDIASFDDLAKAGAA